LASEARWVAWRYEPRGRKPTKVPYSPGDGKAKCNDPRTWGTRAEAETRARKLIDGQNSGGIGIQLGDLGSGMHLGGIDLDSCFGHDDELAPWAEAILRVVPAYTERSPSGRGLKLFFYVASAHVRPFLDLIGVLPSRWGTRRDAAGEDARDHGPAIEVYLSHRYFAVTDQWWPSQPDYIATLDWPSLERIAQLIPCSKSDGAVRNGKDTSRSAIAFRKGIELRRSCATFEQMCEALRSDPETREWVRENCEANDQRQLRRIYDAPDDDFERSEKGAVIPNSQVNIRLGLAKLGVRVAHNIFADRTLVDGPDDKPRRYLGDPKLEALYLLVDSGFVRVSISSAWSCKTKRGGIRFIRSGTISPHCIGMANPGSRHGW